MNPSQGALRPPEPVNPKGEALTKPGLASDVEKSVLVAKVGVRVGKEIMKLYGSRMAIFNTEFDSKDYLTVGTFKLITGEDDVAGRGGTFKATHVPFITSNKMPNIKATDLDNATRNRIIGYAPRVVFRSRRDHDTDESAEQIREPDPTLTRWLDSVEGKVSF